MLWALVACDDESPSANPDDEAPALDDDVPSSDDGGVDAGLAPKRDASAPDASSAVDAGEDGDDEMESMPDGGRRRRDGGARDAGGSAADATAPATDAAVPSAGDCASTASWDPAWAGFEAEVLRLTNEARVKGATCGSKAYPAVKALTMEARLQCAARLYSKEMLETDNFSHTSKDGTTFGARIKRTGYEGNALGENIAKGYDSAASVVAGWLKSEGHCTNIMSGNFTQIGVGYYVATGAQKHWTQDFGKPR